jgi:hypothetical protein
MPIASTHEKEGPTTRSYPSWSLELRFSFATKGAGYGTDRDMTDRDTVQMQVRVRSVTFRNARWHRSYDRGPRVTARRLERRGKSCERKPQSTEPHQDWNGRLRPPLETREYRPDTVLTGASISELELTPQTRPRILRKSSPPSTFRG